MIQGNPDFLAKLMAELEAEKALSVGASDLVQMPQSMIGMQAPEGGMNQQALQASMQGGAPDGIMTGNMPDPSAPINNIPQELSNMGYTPPPALALHAPHRRAAVQSCPATRCGRYSCWRSRIVAHQGAKRDS